MKTLLTLLFIIPSLSWTYSINEQKKICKDLGFTEATEEFADCVLKFYKADKQERKVQEREDELLRMKQEELNILKSQIEEEKRLQRKLESDQVFKNLMDTIQCLGNTQYCSSAYDVRCYNDLRNKGYTEKLAYKTCKLN